MFVFSCTSSSEKEVLMIGERKISIARYQKAGN